MPGKEQTVDSGEQDQRQNTSHKVMNDRQSQSGQDKYRTQEITVQGKKKKKNG